MNTIASRWTALTARERLALMAGGASAFVALCYALIVDPGGTGRARLDHDLPELHERLASMREAAAELARLREAPAIVPGDAAKLRAAIAEAAQRHGVAVRIEEVELEPDGSARVRCAPTPAAHVFAWIHDLHTHRGVPLLDIDVRADGPMLSGLVRFAPVP
jgi:type II secretory pathway component PulM